MRRISIILVLVFSAIGFELLFSKVGYNFNSRKKYRDSDSALSENEKPVTLTQKNKNEDFKNSRHTSNFKWQRTKNKKNFKQHETKSKFRSS